jgi:hypothetical protein
LLHYTYNLTVINGGFHQWLKWWQSEAASHHAICTCGISNMWGVNGQAILLVLETGESSIASKNTAACCV